MNPTNFHRITQHVKYTCLLRFNEPAKTFFGKTLNQSTIHHIYKYFEILPFLKEKREQKLKRRILCMKKKKNTRVKDSTFPKEKTVT